MQKLKFSASWVLLVIFLFLPTLVLAQAGGTGQGLVVPPNPSPTTIPGTQASTITGQIIRIITIILAVAGILAVLFLIWGGFRYITSAGNEEAAEAAKKIITNSIIGLVVVIFSYVIIVVIIRALAQGVT